MEKHKLTESFYYVKTRDRVGGTIKTDVFKSENGIFKAYSLYWQDEDEKIVGYAESYDDERAIKLSRKNLREEWKTEQERLALT